MIARPGRDVQSNVGMYYGYPFAVYDEETDSYGYYTEEDTAEEGWKFNKFNPYPSNTLLLCALRTHRLHPSRLSGKRRKRRLPA